MKSLMPYYHNTLARPVDSILNDDWIRTFFWGNDLSAQSFRVDVRDEGDHYLMEADLPGMTREQIHVDVEQDVLTIRCDSCEESEKAQENYLLNERRFCRMSRAFTLTQVKKEGISAEYKNGVLKLKLPKQRQIHESHSIDIQ